MKCTPPILIALMSLLGCDWMPGKPTAPDVDRGNPAAAQTFDALWGQYCQGCHGQNGDWGGARPMNDPLYQSLTTDAYLTKVTTEGIEGTLMPPFAETHGGWLSEKQIHTLVQGMRKQWHHDVPAYANAAPSLIHNPDNKGDLTRGAQAFASYCAQCHGDDGNGGSAGSIVNDSFLALVSNQALRSTIICGRRDLGMPDFHGYVGNSTSSERHQLPPLTDQQVTDLVSWLASHRVPYPGRPYPTTGNDQPGFKPSGGP